MKRLLTMAATFLCCMTTTFAQLSGFGVESTRVIGAMRLLFTSLLSLCFTIIYAGPVTEQQALDKARLFMKSKKIRNDFKGHRAFENKPQKNEPFYVFNAVEGGYVIVSGDDRTEEILGYSERGNIDLDNIPDNMNALLNIYRKEIESLENKSTTNNVVRPTRDAVAPLIQTQWGQGYPYNLMCPEISGQHAITGCAPTAIAQVLYYYKWPKTENPPLDGYGFVSEFPATTFNWEEMKSDYKNGNYSESEAMAVAEIMRYVGQKLQVGYGLNNTSLWDVFTGSITTTKLKDNNVLPLFGDFGYNPNMVGILRRYTTRSYWEDVIYNEVYEGRPVLIGAGGHEFVCDGYDGDGFFHLNWGWEGINDGYYLLTTIDLYEQNVSNDGDQISFMQNAYIGIRPSKEGDTYNYTVLDQQRGRGYPQLKNYNRNTTSHFFENVNFNMFFINFSDFLFDGDLGVGLFKDGCDISNIVKILQSESVAINSFDVIEKNYEMDFDADIPNGSYVLLPIFKKKDDNEWRIASPHYYYLDISDEVLSIYQITPEYPLSELAINDVLLPDTIVKGEPCTIQIDYTNTNADNYIMVLIYENEEIVQGIDMIADFGQRKLQEIKYTPKNEGKIKFSLRGNVGYSESGTSQDIYYEKEIDIFGDDQLAVDNITTYNNHIVPLVVNLNNSTTNLTAYQFDLILPEGFTLATDSKGKFQVAKTSRYEDDSQQLTVSLQEDGSYRFISFSLSNGIIEGTNGAILNAVMTSADNVTAGTYEGTIKNIVFTKADGTQLKLKDAKFIIVVSNMIMGDANGDGEVNVSDIVEIVNYIMGKPSANFVQAAADLNGDGEVNVTDIVKVVSIIMDSNSSSAPMHHSAMNSNLTLSSDGLLNTAMLQHAGEFTAAQFDVILADGQEIDHISLNSNSNHLLTWKTTVEGRCRVVLYSLTNSAFNVKGDDLMSIRIKGMNDEIAVENVILVAANSNATGISKLTTERNVENWYILDGRMLDSQPAKKGIYIKNGKKVVVR